MLFRRPVGRRFYYCENTPCKHPPIDFPERILTRSRKFSCSKFHFARFTLSRPSKYERFPPLSSHTLPRPRPFLARSSPGLARSSPGPRPALARSSPGPRPALAHPRFEQSSRQNGEKRNLPFSFCLCPPGGPESPRKLKQAKSRSGRRFRGVPERTSKENSCTFDLLLTFFQGPPKIHFQTHF